MNVTKQQVFDAAWNGLKAQGFEMVGGFNSGGIPLRAGCLSCALMHIGDRLGSFAVMEWHARAIYRVYSASKSPADMERRLREFAAALGLTVPGDEKPIPSVDEWARSAVAAVTKYEPYPRLPMGEVLEAKLHRGAPSR